MIISIAMMSTTTHMLILPQFTFKFPLELLIHISRSRPNISFVCPTVISNSGGFSVPSESPPSCFPSGDSIQSSELDTWLGSGTHPSPHIAPCWSPDPFNSTNEIASESSPISCHCLVFCRVSFCLFWIIATASFLVFLPKAFLTSVQPPVSYQSENTNLSLLFICLKLCAAPPFAKSLIMACKVITARFYPPV